jgi:nitrogen regulatory protein P-II 1
VRAQLTNDGDPQSADRFFYFGAPIEEPMKKIECYVRESDVDMLVEALDKGGVGGLTVYAVEGFGRQRGKGGSLLLPKRKVEVIVLDIEVEKVLNTISQVTQKGGFGDGKIAILPVDDVIRIRTGEKGAKALY